MNSINTTLKVCRKYRLRLLLGETSWITPQEFTMKLLLLMLLVGFASAASYTAVDKTADDIAEQLLAEALSLEEALNSHDHGLTDIQATSLNDDITTELGNRLRENMVRLLENLKAVIQRLKTTTGKLNSLIQSLKNMGVDPGDKIRKLLQEIKGVFREILDGLPDGENNSDIAMGRIKLKKIFKKAKKAVKDILKKKGLKVKIELPLGKGSKFSDTPLEEKVDDDEEQEILDMIYSELDDDGIEYSQQLF